MNVSCHIIEDLLPLYHDGVCSEESRALVEEHLAQCEACAALCGKLNGQEETVSVDDTAALQSIQKEWKKSRGKALWRGVIVATLVLGVIAYALSWVDTFKTVPVPTDAMKVSELSQLSDGRIIYRLKVTDGKAFYFDCFGYTPGGDYYITPVRSIIEGKPVEGEGLFHDYFMVDIAETNASRQKQGEVPIKRCFLGDFGDAILLWEEGMELPAASAELERMVRGE